jgi:hypothetical protein
LERSREGARTIGIIIILYSKNIIRDII